MLSSSPFRLLDFGGISSSATITQTLRIRNATFHDMTFDGNANLLEFNSFSANSHHQFILDALTFREIEFKNGGPFISLQ